MDVCVHGFRPTAEQNARHFAGCVANIHWVNCAVAPDPSERTTTEICSAGRDSCGLSALIRASFQSLIWPVKMSVMTDPDNRRFVTWVWPMCKLYMNVVPPATSGM